MFDDHANVVVVEDVLRRIILRECARAPDPQNALDDWLRFLGAKEQRFIDALGSADLSDEAKLNAVKIAGQFKAFADNLASDFVEAIR